MVTPQSILWDYGIGIDRGQSLDMYCTYNTAFIGCLLTELSNVTLHLVMGEMLSEEMSNNEQKNIFVLA